MREFPGSVPAVEAQSRKRRDVVRYSSSQSLTSQTAGAWLDGHTISEASATRPNSVCTVPAPLSELIAAPHTAASCTSSHGPVRTRLERRSSETKPCAMGQDSRRRWRDGTRLHVAPASIPTHLSLRLFLRIKDGFDFSSRDGRRPAPTQIHRATSCGPAPIKDCKNNRCTPFHP